MKTCLKGDVAQRRAARDALEVAIAKAIRDFEEQTGAYVRNVNPIRTRTSLLNISISDELDRVLVDADVVEELRAV